MLSRLDKNLKQAASLGAEFGCCLIYGQEDYPVSYLFSSLKKLIQQQETITVEQYDYSQVSLEDILFNWDALSLFAEKKIIVLSHLDRLKKNDAKLLQEWLDAHHDTSGLFLFFTAVKVDGRLPLVKAVKKYGEVIKTDHLPPAEVRKLMARHGEKYDVSFAPQVIDTLMHYHDGNLQLIFREAEKLALFVGPGGVVKSDEFELLGCGTAAGNIFTLVDELGVGNVKTSLQLLNRLLRDKTVPLIILSMVARHYRLLALASAPSNRGKSAGDLARILRVPPFVVQKIRRQLNKFSLSRLSDSFSLLSEVDFRLKSSKIPESIIMEDMVLTLCRGNARDS